MGIGKTLSRAGKKIQHRITANKHKTEKHEIDPPKVKHVRFDSVEYAKDIFVTSKEERFDHATTTITAARVIGNKRQKVFDPAIAEAIIADFSEVTQDIKAAICRSECRKSLKTLFHPLPGTSESFYFYESLSFSKEDYAIARMDCDRLVKEGIEAKNRLEYKYAQDSTRVGENLDLVEFYESYAQYAFAIDEAEKHQQMVRTLSSERDFHALAAALFKITKELIHSLTQLDSKGWEEALDSSTEASLEEFDRVAAQIGRLQNVTEDVTRHLSALRVDLGGKYSSCQAKPRNTLAWPWSLFCTRDDSGSFN